MTVFDRFEDGMLTPEDIAILCYSQAVQNGGVKDTTSEVSNFLSIAGQLITDYGIEVHLQWVPGHIGIRGNQTALQTRWRNWRLGEEGGGMEWILIPFAVSLGAQTFDSKLIKSVRTS